MKIMRLSQVMDSTGLGRSSIYKYVSEGKFPSPLQLTARSVGWLESEVVEWIQTRIEIRDNKKNIQNDNNSPERFVCKK